MTLVANYYLNCAACVDFRIKYWNNKLFVLSEIAVC